MNKRVLIMAAVLSGAFMLIEGAPRAEAKKDLSLRELKIRCQEKKTQGYDLTEVEVLMREAKQARNKGNYRGAREFLGKAFDALEKAKVPTIKLGKEKVGKATPGAETIAPREKVKELAPFRVKAGDLLSVRTDITGKEIDPFEMSPEFKIRSEEIEPPEIQVTGIMETGSGMLAIVKLNLGNYMGTVILEKGQRVSMPNPKSSQADKWMSYFIVKEINRKGVVIVLENMKEAYLPVLGTRE